MARQNVSDQQGKAHRGHNEGTIVQRKNAAGEVTSYQAQVTAAGGRRSQSFKTRAEARRWLLQARADAAQGKLTARRPPTLRDYLEGQWLPAIQDKVKSRTRASYKGNVTRVPDWLGAVRLDELKPAHFQRFYTELSKAGLKPRTVRQNHMCLHKALKDALRLDLVTRNATEGVTLPRVPHTEPHWYTSAQLQRLFEATAGDRFHALWVVLGTLGLRLGEALGMQWTDIDWQRRTITLARTLQRDRETGELGPTEMKTRSSRRTLTLTPLALQALKAHRDQQEFDKREVRQRGSIWVEHNLVFCTGHGTPLDQSRAHEHWTPACEKAGIPRYRVHDLRHSVASNLVAGGMGLLEVAHFLGHTSADMVSRVYGHVAPADHGRAAALMEALLSRPDAAI